MTPGSGATEVVVLVPWVSVIPSEQVRLLDQPRLAWVRLESEQNKTIPGPGPGARGRELFWSSSRPEKWEAQCLPEGPSPVLRIEAKGVD